MLRALPKLLHGAPSPMSRALQGLILATLISRGEIGVPDGKIAACAKSVCVRSADAAHIGQVDVAILAIGPYEAVKHSQLHLAKQLKVA